ncbi:MAG: HDOD domain-containing protein [Treponema sp.]|nr:HDOD domain-containing protein [Treponema sp.]
MNTNVSAEDIAKIKMAITGEMPLVITTYTLSHNMETYMGNVLSVFLTELHQEQMIQYITYCQNELMTNAKKANTKRIYFKQKRLDINLESDYKKGMKNFKRDTLSNIKHYLYLQKKAGLYIKFIIQVKNNNICLEVQNNSKLTYFEYKRIHDKISKAQQYESIGESMNDVLDDSEGAGLGLIIMILMMRKIGMSEDQFQTICENGITRTRITLPINKEFQKNVLIVSQELENTENLLPHLPEHITRLTQMIDNPQSTLAEIASEISKDVSLSADILKLANSSAFIQLQICRNIVDSIKRVGLRGIKSIALSKGSIQTLSNISEAQVLWEHSYKVAFYSYNLAKNYFTGQSTLIEDSYTCGLLHDIGKIVLEGTYSENLKKLQKICIRKGIDENSVEQLISGVNHSEFGAKIAEKWEFHKNIVNAIRYHHNPDEAPEFARNLIYIVYLADFISYYEKQEVDFYQINKNVLKAFSFTSKIEFEILVEKLKLNFEK